MNKLYKKYLAKLNDFAHNATTSEKYALLQQMKTDISNSYSSGKLTVKEKDALLSSYEVVAEDMRSQLNIKAPKVVESGMLKWAKREIKLAIDSEKKAAEGTDDWVYGVNCYNSALKAYKTLADDNHSGLSMSITKNILNRLVDGKPLTPIEDTSNVWNKITSSSDNTTDYQCKRMGSLFKKVTADGEVTYSDINRVTCYDANSPTVGFHNGFVTKLVDTIFPIKMPYLPNAKPFLVYREDFLVDPEHSDYDTFAILYISLPTGEKLELNRYFKEDDNGQFVPIEKGEYEERKARRVTRE